MSKTLIRKAPIVPVNPASYAYVRYMTANPPSAGADINLPPAAVVSMLHRTMLAVQKNIKPLITWQLYDHDLRHSITMEWSGRSSQLQLVAWADSTGIIAKLWPDFDDNRYGKRPLAAWVARRCVHGGHVEVERHFTESRDVFLSTTDPLFEGIPRGIPGTVDLVADMVAVTQQQLVDRGLAPTR